MDVVDDLLRSLPELAVGLRAAGPHAEAQRGAPGLRLTARQMAAVIHLERHGEQTMSQFARAMGISRAAATELIERLQEKGMVLRGHDDADRRQVRVRLNERFAAQVHQALERRREDVRRALERCPQIDAAALVSFVRALTEELKRAPQ